MSIKILKELGDNKYEVEITPVEKIIGLREVGFGIAHDYVHIDGYIWLNNANNSSSNVKVWQSLHIPIREFNKLLLPTFLKHTYCQPEHLDDRIHTEDDRYWNESWNKLPAPRFKKGDKYPAYAYDNIAVRYYDTEKKTHMVALRLRDEAEYTIMTFKMFNMIKDKLKFE